jgi:hypothetical protein
MHETHSSEQRHWRDTEALMASSIGESRPARGRATVALGHHAFPPGSQRASRPPHYPSAAPSPPFPGWCEHFTLSTLESGSRHRARSGARSVNPCGRSWSAAYQPSLQDPPEGISYRPPVTRIEHAYTICLLPLCFLSIVACGSPNAGGQGVASSRFVAYAKRCRRVPQAHTREDRARDLGALRSTGLSRSTF